MDKPSQVSPKPIRLLHLPKTAGTTVASGLLRVCGRADRFIFSTNHPDNLAKIDAMSASERAAIRVFIGHSLFETGIPEADSALLVTYLREPVSRVKSFISHVAAGRTSIAVDPHQEFSVDHFLESGNKELENLQTKVFINTDRLESDSGIHRLGSAAAFELARKRLFEHVTAFGLQDRFDEGWVAIWHALGISPPLYAMMNRRHDKERLLFTPAQIERIKELNQLDLQLYEAACVEFESRLASGRPPLESIDEFAKRQASQGARFTWVWNKVRGMYYAGRRMKRRLVG